MKKIIFLSILFPGCNPSTQQEEMRWREQTSAAANDRVYSIIAQLKEDCDSSMVAKARKKVDSIQNKKWQTAPPGKRRVKL